MRGRPAVRRCGYWKARGSWRASPGSGTTCADTAHGYIGAVTGGLGAAALYLSCTSGTSFVYFLYTCIHGCGLGRPARPVTSARWSALPVPDRMLPGVRSGPTSQPTSWSSANLMMNCAFGYIPVSSDQANAAWTPASSSSGDRCGRPGRTYPRWRWTRGSSARSSRSRRRASVVGGGAGHLDLGGQVADGPGGGAGHGLRDPCWARRRRKVSDAVRRRPEDQPGRHRRPLRP